MYGTVDTLRTYLPQVANTAANDDLLEDMLTRATQIVDLALQFSFAGYAATASTLRLSLGGGRLLHVPFYQAGTLCAVSLVEGPDTLESYTADEDYEIEGGDDVDAHTWLYKISDTWPIGRYALTAKWGYGSAPESVVGVTLELAVNLWRGRDRGMFSDAIGVEGSGAVAYTRALTNQQKMILDDIRRAYLGVQVA